MRKKFFSILLSICMVLTLLPISAMAEETNTSIGMSGEIIGFAPLAETEKSVPTGTSIEDLKLPESLTATVRTAVTADSGTEEPVQDSGEPEENVTTDIPAVATTTSAIKENANEQQEAPTPEWEETTMDIPVTWTAEPEYNRNTSGVYVFTPVTEGYTVGAALPEITVAVGTTAHMMLSMLTPSDYGDFSVTADEGGAAPTVVNGTLTFAAAGEYTVGMASGKTSTSNVIAVTAGGVTLNLDGVVISAPDGTNGNAGSNAMTVNSTVLNILADSSFTGGMGGITAMLDNGGAGGAGISGNVTVTGTATLTATGGYGGSALMGTSGVAVVGIRGDVTVTGTPTLTSTGGIGGTSPGTSSGAGGSGISGNVTVTDSATLTAVGEMSGDGTAGGDGIRGTLTVTGRATVSLSGDPVTPGRALTGTLTAENFVIKGGYDTQMDVIQASAANSGYQYVTVEPTPVAFDSCNGTTPASVKPDPDPTWGELGYTFAGWYTAPNGGGSALTGEGDDGTTYYAKWTKNGKTVRTTALDLTDISASKLYGSTQNSGVYTNADEGWTWYSGVSGSYAANTLVLYGLILNTTAATALKVPDSSTIVLTAGTTSTIKGGDATSDSEEVCTYGIYGAGTLTINGNGTLSVTAGDATYTGGVDAKSSCSKGIYNDGALTITDTAKVTAAAGVVDFGTASNFEDTQSVGIGCSDALTVNGGTVTGIGGQAFMSFGIGSSGDLTINSGNVIGTGGASIASYGISSGGDLRINGGTVTGTGDISLVSYGIYGKSTIAITGGTVIAISSKEASVSVAVESATSLTVGSGDKPATIVNATDGTSAITTSSGTVASQELIMSGSDAVTISFPFIRYTISGTHTFPGASVGYSDQTPLTITVSNTGNQATGALTVGLSGKSSGSFTISKTSLSSIAVSGNDSFTIKPNNGLSAGTYTATITVSGDNDITDSFAVSFTVSAASPTNGKGGSGSSSPPTVNTNKTETKVDTAGNTATVTTKPDSVSTTGNTASIEATVPSVTVDNTLTSTNGSVVDTAKKAAVTINVPTEAIVQQLAAKKDVDLTITVPSEVAKDTVGNAAVTINANREILEAAKENLTDVTIKIKDADTQQLAYSWTFKGEDLAKSTVPVNDVNIAMSVHLTTEVPKVNVITPNNKGLVLSFDHSGLLPSVASVKFSALEKGFKPGQTLYFYYYNPTTHQIESLGKDAYIVDADGNVTVQISHCSDYVLLPKAVRTITLDTRTYTMPPKKSYEIGLKLTGVSNTTIKAYSSTKGVANVAVLKNGNVRATGVKPGLTYIMIDVYDSKNKFLTHASIRLTVQNGVKESGNSARQYGIF